MSTLLAVRNFEEYLVVTNLMDFSQLLVHRAHLTKSWMLDWKLPEGKDLVVFSTVSGTTLEIRVGTQAFE